MIRRTLLALAVIVAGGALAQAGSEPEGRVISGELRTPVAVALFPDGAVAVADDATPAVTLFEADGRQRWSTTERLVHPSGLHADADALWVADAGSGLLLRLDPANGATLETVDLGRDLHPSDVVATAQGTLWVSASTDDTLVHIDPATRSLLVVDDVSGRPIEAPRGLAPDGHGGVWVVESLSGRVHRFSATGEVVRSVGSWGIGAGRFAKPKDLAALPNGGLLVLDAQLGLVQRLDAAGDFVSVLSEDGVPLRFEHPLGIASLGDRVAVAETGAHRVHLLPLDRGPEVAFPAPSSLVSYSSIRDMDPGLVCRQCHDGTRRQSPGIWDPGVRNHPLEIGEGTELPEDVERTKEGELTCFSCHGIHRPDGAAPPPEDELAQERIVRDCGHCHEEIDRRSTTPEGDGHPVGKNLPLRADRELLARITVVEDDRVACRTCHRPHGATEDHLLVSSAADATLCLTCHSGEADHPSGHPMDVEPDAGMRGLLERSGGALTPSGQLSCLSCHGIHDAVGGPLLRIGGSALASCEACHAERAREHADSAHHEKSCVDCHGMHRDNAVTDAACGACHEDEQAATDRGGHGDASCRDCHRVHGDQAWAGFAPPDPALNPASTTCLACHHPSATPDLEGPIPRVTHYEHPVDVFTPDGEAWTSLGGLPLFGSDGEPVPTGEKGVVACGTCHLTHGPAETRKRPQMRRAEWKQTCPMCHGPNALQFYQYFHYPDGR